MAGLKIALRKAINENSPWQVVKVWGITNDGRYYDGTYTLRIEIQVKRKKKNK